MKILRENTEKLCGTTIGKNSLLELEKDFIKLKYRELIDRK